MPFVCGATNLGEALRRITEGAAMIRSKGEAGTGDVSNATTHMRQIGGEIRRLTSLAEDELYVAAKELQAPYDLVVEVARAGKLPVTLFTAGSPDLKMPEPTNTPSAPSCIIIAASAGVAMPPAVNIVTGSLPARATSTTSS